MIINNNEVTIECSDKMSEDELMVLAYFLNLLDASKLRIEKDIAYIFPQSKSLLPNPMFAKMTAEPFCTIQSIKLSHTLIKRSRHSKPQEPRYEVVGMRLGSGNYGQVDDFIGTLSKRYDGGLEFLNAVHRVGKTMQFDSIIKPGESEKINEYHAGSKATYLHMHKPVFFQSTRPLSAAARAPQFNEAMIIMRYLHGYDLSKVVQENNNTEFKLQLALVSFKALKQTHQAGIVHKDIKPDNLKVILGPLGPQISLMR